MPLNLDFTVTSPPPDPQGETRALIRELAETRARMLAYDQEYAQFLDKLIHQYPRVLTLRQEQEAVRLRMLKLERDIDEAVRAGKQTVMEAGITFQFSNPCRTTYDAELLCSRFPAAREIEGLLQFKVEVHPETFKAAVAAGLIPGDVAAAVERKEPTTKAGKIDIKYPFPL